MKCKTLAIAALFSAAGAQFASASDGTINFNGELTDQTCTIAVNGTVSPAIATVTLPAVSVASLTVAGQVSGATSFNIELSNCSRVGGTAAAFFEAGGSVDQFTGNLNNTAGVGGATNVQLQLLDSQTGSQIQAGNSSQISATTRNFISGGGPTIMPYAVQYYALGATTAGPVTSSVTYSINYQ